MKWFQKWKERKQLKQRQSTRQLMGVRKVLPHGVAVPGGCLVFFLIHPDNLSVLSAEGIRQRVTALSNLFRAEEQVEVLALDSRVSFQKNQAYYQTRLEEETAPKGRCASGCNPSHFRLIPGICTGASHGGAGRPGRERPAAEREGLV